MRLKAIKVSMVAYPATMQDTLAGVQEVINIQKFVSAVEEAALKFLPRFRSTVKIEEERESEIR